MKSSLSINEFSKLSGIEITTLRYWDAIGIFSPSSRNPDNNYRYYSPKQIIAVKFINVMSNIGVPLKELATVKQEQEPKRVLALLSRQSRQMNEELRRLQESLSVINERQEFIRLGMEILNEINEAKEQNPDFTKISVVERDISFFVRGPRNIWKKDGNGFYDSFVNFLSTADDLRINLNLPIGGVHDTWEHFMGSPGEPDSFFSVDLNGNKPCAPGKYMVAYTHGNYGELGDLSEKMAEYAKEHSLKVSGPVYTVYLLDEVCYKDSSKFLSQTYVAVSSSEK
jgi:Predicted transcriptional regulators